MSKVLTEEELLEIITDTIRDGRATLTYERGSHRYFIEELAKIVAYYGGADLVCLSEPDVDGLGWCAHFAANECTPSDGGVFKHYDTDVPVQEWINEYRGD